MSVVLQGIVSRVIYSKDGWTVARLTEDVTDREYSFVGNMGTVIGEHLELTGNWNTHVDFGDQFKVNSYSRNIPTTEQGVIALLSSGLIKGIGNARAKWMVNHFGLEIVDLIKSADDRLLEVPGIGEKLKEDIFTQWHQFYGREQLVTHLASSGFTKNMIRRIIVQFDDSTLSKIEDNPYELMTLPGVGFYRADYFARLLGASDINERRIQESLVYLLEENGKGNTYLPKDILFDEFQERIKFTTKNIDKISLFDTALKALSNIRRVIIDKKGIHLSKFSIAETNIAKELIERSLTAPDVFSIKLIRKYIKEWQDIGGFDLSLDQESAIVRSLLDNVTIITGAPGTGKTSTLAAMLYVAKQKEFKLNVTLVAPTGRAAKRMQETTGVPSSTIHRLLGFGIDGDFSFKYNRENKYPTDILIVDEVSMIDVMLMNSLLKALRRSTKLILVGDKDQLQSVSAGNVLDDVIRSGKVNTVELRFNFRQKSNALLVENANKINAGHVLNNKNPLIGGSSWGSNDFYITNKVNKDTILDIVTKHIPKAYGIPSEDILVLTPMRKRFGELNCTTLNEELQNLHNKGGAALPIDECNLKVGDLVMQTRNDYMKDVFNGDIGKISAFTKVKGKRSGTFTVEFYNNEVQYDFIEWKQLQHAWVTTIHKAQGSEAEAVVCVLPDNYITRMMLTRNLLYTGITRAKKVCVLVSKDREIVKAIQTSGTDLRYTDLTDKLEHWYIRLSKVKRY
jgi:exodeoxyribonuclease V alpha subunit